MQRLLIIYLLVYALPGLGQQLLNKPHAHRGKAGSLEGVPSSHSCGYEEYVHRLEKEGTYNSQRFIEWATSAQTLQKHRSTHRQGVSYVIPVVVHIIEGGAFSGNMTATQVQSQINVLNADFKGENWSRSQVRNTVDARFADIASSLDITFKLATLDNNGLPMAVPGIDRITDFSQRFPDVNTAQGISLFDMDRTIKPSTIWNPNEYLNIWVIDIAPVIANNSLINFNGIATPPSAPENRPVEGLQNNRLPGLDGVIIDYLAFGSNYDAKTGVRNNNFLLNTNSQLEYGRTATHEVGHWLGLFHIYGRGRPARDAQGNPITPQCNDQWVSDYIEDTPPMLFATEKVPPIFGNPAPDCDFYYVNSCGQGIGGDQLDMIENYMDLSPDKCMGLFTKGQIARMELVLDESPLRRDLINSKKADPLTSTLFASFQGGIGADAFRDMVTCLNAPVSFTDLSVSTNGAITSWTWDFDVENTGEVSQKTFSGQQPPAISFRRAGAYVVRLTVSQGSVSESTTRRVFILPENVNGFPDKQDFEVGQRGWVFPASGVGHQWFLGGIRTSPSEINTIIYAENYTIPMEGYNVEFLSPLLNVNDYEKVTLSFEVAYTYYQDNERTIYDALEIGVYSGCTSERESVWTKEGEALATLAGGTDRFWFPQSPGEWRTESIDLTPSALTQAENGFIAFRNIGRSGNNLFIDNIVIEAEALLTPQALEASSDYTQAKILLRWQDASQKETGYEVERSESLNGPFSKIASLPANSTSYEDGKLQAGKTYYYQVRAVGTQGQVSTFSSPANNLVAVIASIDVIDKISQQVYLFPNPASSVFNLELGNLKVDQLSLEDISGRRLLELVPASQSLRVPTEGLANGVYFLTIHTSEGKGVKRLSILK